MCMCISFYVAHTVYATVIHINDCLVPSSLLLQVFVGGNIEEPLSQQLEYIDAESAVPLVIIIPCVVGGLLLVVAFSVFLICCIACCYNTRARKKEKQWTNLLAQMELMEMEMAEECKRGELSGASSCVCVCV